MVSAMMAMTASVSPTCQETRIENATTMTTATTTRSSPDPHPRVRGQVGQVPPALADAGRLRAP